VIEPVIPVIEQPAPVLLPEVLIPPVPAVPEILPVQEEAAPSKKPKPATPQFTTAPFATAPFASPSLAPTEPPAEPVAGGDQEQASTVSLGRVAGIAGTLVLAAGAVVAFAWKRPRSG
jgi:hypothetical protein